MSGRFGRFGRVRKTSAVEQHSLATGWELLGVAADEFADPSALPSAGWIPARAPGTVASSLRDAGAWDFDAGDHHFGSKDWWWRLRFAGPEAGASDELALRLDGLATLAEVWLNGAKVGSSANMFVAERLPVELRAENELAIRFRSLERALSARRPRPRWRVPMLEQQQLRWFRTSLLGHTRGWSPPCPAIGPYRGVSWERRVGPALEDVVVRPSLRGGAGVLQVSARLLGSSSAQLEAGEVVLERGGVQQRAAFHRDGDRLNAEVQVADVELWWPHTHGVPALYALSCELRHSEGVALVDLGAVGFRELAVDRERGDFQVRVNGVPVFCRGACWTPLDPVSFDSDAKALRALLEQVARAGMNMLRVGGTMTYEVDAFYDLCDELGILVWQDFMFANMDYPEDEPFVAEVRREVTDVLGRLQGRPSLAVLCGSSEGEQQAAMWGAPRESWQPSLFHEVLPALVAELAPDAVYWPSSAHGGEFPHVCWSGTTSYYGVGAYLRPLEDARRSEVRFASECLAFANVPHPEALPGGPSARVHHPAWKARTPRDLGAGWDFDDVRDHYVERLFGVDTRALRYGDHERYLELGRVAVGEVMAATIAEWRRSRSQCRGALIWFLKDLWPSAGWGVFDASGAPKSVYFYLRRVMQPVFLGISDEGLNGVSLHAVNDTDRPLAAELRVRLFKHWETPSSEVVKAVELEAHGARELPLAAWLEGFNDVTYAYRFGPPSVDLVTASLEAGGTPLATAYYFPLGLPREREMDLGLSARGRSLGDGRIEVVVQTRRFAQAVTLDVQGATADDAYFHVAPGASKTVVLTLHEKRATLRGSAQALNAAAPVPIRFE